MLHMYFEKDIKLFCPQCVGFINAEAFVDYII